MTRCPGAAPNPEGIKRSCRVISLVVSFVQPVIVPCLHDSAQTVPRDLRLNPEGESGVGVWVGGVTVLPTDLTTTF